MRIQWNGDTAQEMLEQLKRARQGLADCRAQAAVTFCALDDANPDGDDRALNKARQRIETQVQRMQRLSDSLDDFIVAIQTTDDMFAEAERENIRRIDNADQSLAPMIHSSGRSVPYIEWRPEAFAVIPELRLNTVVLPKWLSEIANDYEGIPFV